ncbi:uncharacterized protein LOC110856085 isoform X2 [Folsomia candida]|uniref:uncharacterized protein LOC110856085 isoform X2 n=1 Tax=Folsomia candida TaxID=158441 RepID=UPI001604F800|nr:uncharacterized protein LOC110856085 isoform X2 [Folsomia candida]
MTIEHRASMELMESIFKNELLLENIFSSMNLNGIKTVRFVNKKWKRIAAQRFSEISRVFIQLNNEFSRIKVDINDKPFIVLKWGDDINTALDDKLATFKHFKLSITISEEAERKERSEQAFLYLTQVLRHLRCPNGSLIHSLMLHQIMKESNISIDQLASISEACNDYSHVEIRPRGYSLVDASKLPKMICNTLRVYYSTDVVHAFSNFLKTKKVIFVDASFISLDKVTAAINGNAEQFGALEEIDITMKVNVKELLHLAVIHPLRRLSIRIVNGDMLYAGISSLTECITRHAPMLEVLSLEFLQSRIKSEFCKFEGTEFPKLMRLYIGKDVTFVDTSSRDVDIFNFNGGIEVIWTLPSDSGK